MLPTSTPILTDFSPPALTAAIKANLYALIINSTKSPPGQAFQNNQLRRWQTPIGHPWFNGVLSLQAPSPTADQLIQETLAYFRRQSVSAFTWWLAPNISRHSWEPLLLAHGFQYDANTPGMALDLQTLAGPTEPLPDGFQIRRVTDEKTFRTWVTTFSNGYGLPAEWEPALYDLNVGLGFDQPQRHFLGTYHGKPVATSTLNLADGVAGVYNVATIPEARRIGLGRLVTLQSLLEGRQLGYRIATLQSSQAGYNVYLNLGFQHICQMEHYYWRDTSSLT